MLENLSLSKNFHCMVKAYSTVSLCFHHFVFTTEVVIGFDPDNYHVNEPDGSVDIFVSVREGKLKKNVTVQASLLGQSAGGILDKSYR